MKIFTEETLPEFNGKDGRPSYVAYKGLVYDVTESYHWKEGTHWVLHDAGKDLTKDMCFAPHFEDVLLKFPIVGKFIKNIREIRNEK